MNPFQKFLDDKFSGLYPADLMTLPDPETSKLSGRYSATFTLCNSAYLQTDTSNWSNFCGKNLQNTRHVSE